MLKELFIKNAYGFTGGSVDTFNWKFGSLSDLITTFVSLLLVIAGIAFTIVLIYGGIRYMTSGGDAKQVDSSKKVLTGAIIGIIIVGSVFAVSSLFGKYFGAKTFGGRILTLGGAGGGGGGGIVWVGDYSQCSYYDPDDLYGNVACSGPSCCGSVQDCVNIRAVSAVSSCGVPLCQSEGCSGIDWSGCWTTWWQSNQSTANDLCVKCNICNR